MSHLLDNPVWSALLTHNRHLGTMSDLTCHFDPEVSPFAALATADPALLENLYAAIPFENPVALVSNIPLNSTGKWKRLVRMEGCQMIYDGPKPVESDDVAEPVMSLSEQFVFQMLALTELTKPGPFLSKTIQFGHYEGIFSNDKLIAMAGQRLHFEGFAEISAVCTDPGHLGKGYARKLLQRQVARILEASETPFLHVKADNYRAIEIYKSLGFKLRSSMFFDFLDKK